MKKTKLFAGAVLSLIGGLAMTSVASATAPVTAATVNGIGTLTVCGHEYVGNTDSCITIMDHNLGATSNDINNTGSFGNYYFWGNNTPITIQDEYNPDLPWVNYSEDDDAWGGGNDELDDSYSAASNGYPINNPTDRQGPCPAGYHVPSLGEWNALMDMYAGENKSGHYDEYEGDSDLMSGFYNAFYIPFNGYYSIEDQTLHENTNGSYSVCLGTSSKGRMYLYGWTMYDWGNNIIELSSLSALNDYADGMGIRCFKDTPVTSSDAGSTPSRDLIAPTIDEGFQTTIGGDLQSGFPTPTITTNTVNQVNGQPVRGEVNVDFGSNAPVNFSHLAEVNIPVGGISYATVLVKHGGSSEYNYDGLTTNRNATCTNGAVASQSDRYNGETVSVQDGYVTIYTCSASSFVALESSSAQAQILLVLDAGEVIIGVDTGASGSIKNLGSVNVSNLDQILSGSFGTNYFWIEDMKGAESGYYTTLSITDLTGDIAPHMISKSNIRLKPTGVTLISGATVVDPFVVIGANNTRNDWMTGDVVLTYFNRQNTPVNNAGRVGRYGDDLEIKVNIPRNTPADTYRATITYTLYDLAQ